MPAKYLLYAIIFIFLSDNQGYKSYIIICNIV